jgi:hypothetical protein
VVTNCDHLAKLKFSRALPYAFTEYGALALANVLASSQAVEMSIYVMRPLRAAAPGCDLHEDLAKRLAELEKTERLELSHDTFSRNTRVQLRLIFEALGS